MNVYPRSNWTAIPPKPATVGDNFIGLPYFTTPPTGVEFHPVGKDVLYVHRNPTVELNLLLKEATLGTGLSDIDFNYAISQNTRGVYVLRGGYTKCMSTDKIKVLLLLGTNERPTDVLKENQRSFKLPIQNPTPPPVLKLGDSNVHVFNLIEFLAQLGFYKSRNDGIYGPLTVHAVKELQLSLDIPNLTGIYDDWIYSKLNTTREYVQLDA